MKVTLRPRPSVQSTVVSTYESAFLAQVRKKTLHTPVHAAKNVFGLSDLIQETSKHVVSDGLETAGTQMCLKSRVR